MEAKGADYSHVVLGALILALLTMMNMASFLAVFGGAAIITGIGVAWMLGKRRDETPSIVSSDNWPTPKLVEAVLAQYRGDIEEFWQQWKTRK